MTADRPLQRWSTPSRKASTSHAQPHPSDSGTTARHRLLSGTDSAGRGADQGLPRAESLRSWGPALRVVLGPGSRGLTPALPGRQSGRNAKVTGQVVVACLL